MRRTGTTDWVKLEANQRVKIAQNGHLKELARTPADSNERG